MKTSAAAAAATTAEHELVAPSGANSHPVNASTPERERERERENLFAIYGKW